MNKQVVLLSFVGFLILTSACLTTETIPVDTLEPSPAAANTRLPTPTETHLPTPTGTTASTNTLTPTPFPPTKTPLPPTATESLVDELTAQLTGDFDYFILALAWEPDFCASNDDPQACAPGLKLAFILHGLWPTYDQGWPSYCSTEGMTNELIAEYPGLYPNDFLYTHEWEKHGTCTGLDPEGYLLLSQELKDSVIIPDIFVSPEEPFRMDADQLIDVFVQANPFYGKESFSLLCSGSGQFLSELYVCFSRDGQPTKCGSDMVETNAESCLRPDFLVREPR